MVSVGSDKGLRCQFLGSLSSVRPRVSTWVEMSPCVWFIMEMERSGSLSTRDCLVSTLGLPSTS